jgi:hypothetical protein
LVVPDLGIYSSSSIRASCRVVLLESCLSLESLDVRGCYVALDEPEPLRVRTDARVEASRIMPWVNTLIA